MSREDNRAVVERFWGALETAPPTGAALEAWKDLFADDAVWEMPFAPAPLVTEVPGRALIGHFVDWFFGAAPDLRITSLDIQDTTDPELFVLELQGEATVAASGRTYANTYCTHMRIVDGRVSVFREYFNPAAVMDAFGREALERGVADVMAAAGAHA